MTRSVIPSPMVEGFRFRPLQAEDLPQLLQVILAEADACGAECSETLSDLEREMRDPWSPPATDSLLALDAQGAIAGLARAFAKPAAVERDAHAFLALHLRPDLEASALSGALLGWVEELGRARLRSVAGGFPPELRIACDRKQGERSALFEGHGFRAGRVFWRMRRDLSEPIAEPVLPDTCEARSYDPGLDRRLLEVFNETFSDHWGFEPVVEEDWRVFFTGSAEFRPDLTKVVLAGEEIAGYSLNQVNAEECARLGERRGWIGQLGVRRPWRHRGIATALLHLSMRAFRAAGLEAAVLGVDSENLTGAVGLYERAGFRTTREVLLYVKDASSSAGSSSGGSSAPS